MVFSYNFFRSFLEGDDGGEESGTINLENVTPRGVFKTRKTCKTSFVEKMAS